MSEVDRRNNIVYEYFIVNGVVTGHQIWSKNKRPDLINNPSPPESYQDENGVYLYTGIENGQFVQNQNILADNKQKTLNSIRKIAFDCFLLGMELNLETQTLTWLKNKKSQIQNATTINEVLQRKQEMIDKYEENLETWIQSL